MRLKYIEIYGFKSFADKVHVDFSSGITAVVGPNGSGKSNVTDAIRWVLGEQSTRVLRGGKMEDVIFAGTEKRKPINYAEVTMVIDNSSHEMPLEYDEIAVTRRFHRSGEGEYLINGRSCRLKDIHDLFLDTGVGKGGYSIIGQGKIEEIIMSQPEDRRLFFEEAAGILKFKFRKKEALKKLQSTEQSIQRIRDILNEVGGQLDQLAQQAEAARRHNELKENIRQRETKLFSAQIKNIREKRLKMSEDLKEYEQKKAEAENRYRELENSMRDSTQQIENASAELNSAMERFYQMRSAYETAQNDVQTLKERIEFYDKQIAEISSETSGKQKMEEYIQKQSRIIAEITAKEEALAQMEQENKSVEAQLKQYEAEIIDMNRRIEEGKNSLFELINSEAGSNNVINAAKLRKSQAEKKKERLAEELAKADSELDQVKQQHKVLADDIAQKTSSKQQIEDRLTKLRLDIETGIAAKNEAAAEYSRLNADLAKANSKKHMLESMLNDYEGYSRPVKLLMQALKAQRFSSKGIAGTVGDILDAKDGYQLAIETALGQAVQNVIVDDESIAKQAIKYLKDNSLGKVTFLPMNVVKQLGGRDDSLANMDGAIGYADELVNYDQKFKGIIGFLLGRVLIAKTYDAAVSIARKNGYRTRIVTLAGELFSPGGAITGGGGQERNSGLLARKNEIKSLAQEALELEKQLAGQKNLISASESSVENYNRQVAEMLVELQNEEKTIKELEQDAWKCSQRMHQLEETANVAHYEIESIEEEIAASDAEITASSGEYEIIIDKKKSIEEMIVELKARQEVSEPAITELRQDLQQKKENYVVVQQELRSQKENKQSIENEMEFWRSRLDENKGRFDEYTSAMETAKVNLARQIEAAETKEKDLAQIDEQVKSFEEKLHQVKESNRSSIDALSEVDAAKNSVYDSINQLNIKFARSEDEEETVLGIATERYPGFVMEDVMLNQRERSLVSSEVEMLKTELFELGQVNPNAMEEYEAAKERFDFMSTQESDLTGAKEKLDKLISEIDHDMQKSFVDTFEQVRENFGKIFVKLFGGGKADLALTDENLLEAGVEILAQPPGTKLSTLSPLSGGQKTLTAISLLFAFLMVKSSPFVILDEIEAALDDENTDRFSTFLQEFAHTSQFIVVTHQKKTMTVADLLHGITMQEHGVSKLVSVSMEEVAV